MDLDRAEGREGEDFVAPFPPCRSVNEMLRPTWSDSIPDAIDLSLGRERDLAVSPPAGSACSVPLPAGPRPPRPASSPGRARGPGTVSCSGCGARIAAYPGPRPADPAPLAAAPPPVRWLPELSRVLSDAVERVPRLARLLELPSLGRDLMGAADGQYGRRGGGVYDGGGVFLLLEGLGPE